MDVDQRIERLIQEHERAIARMDRAEKRMDHADARMDRAFERMDLSDKRFEERMAKLEQRSNRHEAEFKKRNESIQKLLATGMRMLVANQDQAKETERKINALVEAQLRNEVSIKKMMESLKQPRNGGSHA